MFCYMRADFGDNPSGSYGLIISMWSCHSYKAAIEPANNRAYAEATCISSLYGSQELPNL